MIKNQKCTALVVALGLALLAQLLNPTRAYADGETPASSSDTAAETATVAPTEVIVAETPTPEPAALSPDKPGVDMIPIESLTRNPADTVETGTPPPPAEPPETPDKPAEQVTSTSDLVEATPSAAVGNARVPALGDVLRDLPENTNVIVLDNIGKPLSLASQEAVQVIIESDPVWCPAGQAPTPGLNGCTSSYATLADLVTNVGATIAGSGTIWITNGPVLDAGPITIDGSSYSTWANYSLILQGGWSGISGDPSIVSNSVFSVPITIANWNSDLTINNVTSSSINITMTNPPFPANQPRNVTFDHVITNELTIDRGHSTINIRNSTISNGTGAYIQGGSNRILIDNSLFENSSGNGISISNIGGSVTMNNSISSGNFGTGLTISEAYSIDILNSLFTGNTGGGIYITSNTGTGVLIDNITVDRSSGFGVGIATSGGNVTINDSAFMNTSSDFNNPYFGWGDGIDIFNGGGNITVNGSHFIGNAFDGLFAVGVGDVTISESEFSTNVGSGVNLGGTGNITISQSQSNGNGFNGLSVSGGGDITIAQSVFYGQGGSGVAIIGAGNVSLDNIVATDNYDIGVFISDIESVTLKAGFFSNNTTGLCIFSVNGDNIVFNPEPVFSNNTINIAIDDRCSIPFHPPQPTTFLQTQGELFSLDCVTVVNRYVVRLANDDRGEIFCPVDGEASIDRVDNTTLPASLPAGYTYASAFDVEIIQNNKPLRWIVEGGYITASFLAQNSQSGNVYSILYWDEETRTWIPLKELLLDAEGKPEVLPLFPGVDGDLREIRSGVNVVTKNGETRVEVSTNFPGIFVLAQH